MQSKLGVLIFCFFLSVCCLFSNARHYPDSQMMMKYEKMFHGPSANAYSLSSLNLRSSASSSSFSTYEETISTGYVYYNFYSNFDCTGKITYQSGVAANICLDSDYFGIPNNDSYIPDFATFRVTSVNSNCEGTLVSFYNDSQCLNLIRTTILTNFQQCLTTSNLLVKQLASAFGNCSVGNEIPLAQPSYVLSEYVANNQQQLILAQQCASPIVSSFNAYPNNLCYTTSNTTSLYFTCSSDSGSISMNYYYNSSICKVNGELSEQTLNISNTCSLQSNFTNKYGYILNTCDLLDSGGSGSSSSSSADLSDGAIAGIVVGGLAAIAIVFLVLFGIYGNAIFASSFWVSRSTNASTSTSIKGERTSEMSTNPMVHVAESK